MKNERQERTTDRLDDDIWKHCAPPGDLPPPPRADPGQRRAFDSPGALAPGAIPGGDPPQAR